MARTSSLKRSSLNLDLNGNLAKGPTPLSATQAVENLKRLIRQTFKSDPPDPSLTADLKSFIVNEATFGRKGDRVALVLIDEECPQTNQQWEDSIWALEKAPNLLLWLLDTFKQAFDRKPDNTGLKKSDISDRLALHLAIERKNYGFLDCLFRLRREELDKIKSIFEKEEKVTEGMNAVHLALYKGSPFSAAFVTVCSAKALIKVDGEGCTPIHYGMRREDARADEWLPSPHSASEQRLEKDRPVPLGRQFRGRELLDIVKDRKDEADILPKVLTAVALTGSLYQEVAKVDLVNGKELNRLIFWYLKSILDATKVLYGNSSQGEL